MRITSGPTMQKFADCFGCDIEEVVEWVNSYVNGPWSDEQMPVIESTHEERLAYIKGYIEWRVSTSLTSKVKESLHESVQ